MIQHEKKKTEALPTGTPEQKQSDNQRILGTSTNKIPKYVCLIKDGKPMRTLDLWVGNDIIIEDNGIKSWRYRKR